MKRLLNAWRVLMGQRLTPQQIAAEWLEYQQIFENLLQRWSAQLARDAKQEHKRIKRLEVPDEAAPTDRKAALRKRVATMRGLRPSRPPQLELHPPPDQEN